MNPLNLSRRMVDELWGAFITCGRVQYTVNTVNGHISIHVKIGLSDIDGEHGFLGRRDENVAVWVLEEEKAIVRVESGELVAVEERSEVEPPEGGWREGVVEEEGGGKER
ncbi:hypothetical protein ACH5RR_000571 [Cinchona calisaya]|uniref:Uncharacterized protein n=1 Tax=Cinchona calisaya TaxID=153742 RepID=A0ABD3B101_9GENT